VRQTLEALLAANRRARMNYRIFWMSLPVFILPTLIGVFQLGEVGKATDRNIWQMLLVFGVALAASRRLERAAVLQGAEAGATAAGGIAARVWGVGRLMKDGMPYPGTAPNFPAL
jgi:hypothetical protein